MLFMVLVEHGMGVIVTVDVAVKIVTSVQTTLTCMLVGFMIVQILLG
tara:strand:- start:2 stop:142 length:141 start_codon:yes stop_codon:yes gene_type:complete